MAFCVTAAALGQLAADVLSELPLQPRPRARGRAESVQTELDALYASIVDRKNQYDALVAQLDDLNAQVDELNQSINIAPRDESNPGG